MQPVREPILTRSRAAAAPTDVGRGLGTGDVKAEPVEPPRSAENGRRGSAEPFSAETPGVLGGFGVPAARWYPWDDDDDDMDGPYYAGAMSTMVKFNGNNSVMKVPQLEAAVHQRCMDKSSRRSATASTMINIERFGVSRDCC